LENPQLLISPLTITLTLENYTKQNEFNIIIQISEHHGFQNEQFRNLNRKLGDKQYEEMIMLMKEKRG
jgi:hypothetical protein